MRLFFMTVQFLTRIPIPFFKTEEILSEEAFAKGIVFYPLVGFLIGGIAYIAYCMGKAWDWGTLDAFFAVAANIIVTGAFHLDGLADTCDAIFSSRNRERMLEIMRDSRLGTNGAIAVVLDILLRMLLLSMIWEEYAFFGVVLAPVAGKMATPILMHTVYARKEEGLGNLYIGKVSDRRLIFTTLLGVFILTAFMGQAGTGIAVFVMVFAYLFRRYLEKIIGGMTGDTLGAGSELCELLFMVLLSLCMGRVEL